MRVASSRHSAAAVMLFGALAFSAAGQGFSVLHTFAHDDGAACDAALIQATDGQLYGTCDQGGVNGAPTGDGTIFHLDTSGNFVKMHDFDDVNGAASDAPLLLASNGSFYGTTRLGGALGLGTVFRLDPDGSFVVLHHFSAMGSDGGLPYASLIEASDGFLYGVTEIGGEDGFYGTLFRLTLDGTLVTLHAFDGENGGGMSSQGRLLEASDGNFYGTTAEGGAAARGTVFRMQPGGQVTILHDFTGPDGEDAQTGLIEADDGFLYGTTTRGGACSQPTGCGTTFRISKDGDFASLHAFDGSNDGMTIDSELIQASDGLFYGVTRAGGANNHGTIFRMDANGDVTTIHHLTADDGLGPGGALLEGSDGNLYGTTTTTVFAVSLTAGAPLYCPNAFVRRDQMAVFLLKTEHGSAHVPPACAGSFGDVSCPSLFAVWIEELASEGITGGCGGGDYCPLAPVTRGQMAVFLLKTEHGSSHTPPACTGVFPDVPCGSQFADWIEELAAEGVTGGCGGGNYCPTSPVTRAQMAAFLLKIEHGSAYTPPACTPFFGDVLCPSLFADWIEELYAEGITAGCSGS